MQFLTGGRRPLSEWCSHRRRYVASDRLERCQTSANGHPMPSTQHNDGRNITRMPLTDKLTRLSTNQRAWYEIFLAVFHLRATSFLLPMGRSRWGSITLDPQILRMTRLSKAVLRAYVLRKRLSSGRLTCRMHKEAQPAMELHLCMVQRYGATVSDTEITNVQEEA